MAQSLTKPLKCLKPIFWFILDALHYWQWCNIHKFFSSKMCVVKPKEYHSLLIPNWNWKPLCDFQVNVVIFDSSRCKKHFLLYKSNMKLRWFDLHTQSMLMSRKWTLENVSNLLHISLKLKLLWRKNASCLPDFSLLVKNFSVKNEPNSLILTPQKKYRNRTLKVNYVQLRSASSHTYNRNS